MATFSELTGIDPTAQTGARPLDTIHEGGVDTRRAAANEQELLRRETGAVELATAIAERSMFASFINDISRSAEYANEEGFDPQAWIAENRDSLPGYNLEAFAGVGSTQEAEALRADQIRAQENDARIQSRGFIGVGGQLLAGMIDPMEVAIGFATLGSGKTLNMAQRIRRSARMGLMAGTASGVMMNQVDPLADASQIVYGGLSGAVLGGAIGLAPNRTMQGVQRSYPRAVRDLPDASTETFAQTTRPFTIIDGEMQAVPARDTALELPGGPRSPADDGASLGAASVQRTGILHPEEMNDRHLEIFDQALDFNRTNRIGERIDSPEGFADTPAGRTARRMSDALSQRVHQGLMTDFDRLSQTGGTIEQNLAYNLLESPEGRVRNNTSATMLREQYEARMASHSMPVLEEAYTSWAKSRNIGFIERNRTAARQAFDREVIAELEARFHEGKPISQVAEIKAAADGIDANYREAVAIGKGRSGEAPMSGFEDMQPKSGFFNHRWNGAGIRRLLAQGRSRDEIAEALAHGYAKTNPDMTPADRTMISKAVVRRALASSDGVDSNMLTTMTADAQDYLREMLEDSGYDAQTIDRLMDAVRGNAEERGKAGFTKARVQVDLRTEYNGIALMDLVDTNLTRTLSQYNRSVAGGASLARKGIQNRGQRKQIIDAAMAERRARGIEVSADDRKFLEDIFTYFDSGPIGGGVEPTIMRAKRLTNLALLNQMGMTQLGETGAQMAAVGMDTWKRHSRALHREMAKQGPSGPIIKELQPIMGRIGEEHMLFRDDLMLDELRDVAEVRSFVGSLDQTMAKGQRLQGYLSGFFHVKAAQQRIAVASMADKAMQRLRDGVDEAELNDIGVPQSLKRYIDDGTVEFTPEGYLDRLNLDRWDVEDAEAFSLALRRHTNQVVQRAMAGEESVWMHRTVGSMYMHLKSFPMLAMRKQSVRAMGVSNGLAVASVMMGLATAGLAYEAKQIINGRTERVSGEDMLRGAVGMSNMTGWVPMLTDPGAAILGMDDLRFSQFGRHSIDTGIIALPPAFSTLNKMARLPGAVNPLADLSPNERIRIAQTTPIIGNLYGFSAVFNAMKQ